MHNFCSCFSICKCKETSVSSYSTRNYLTTFPFHNIANAGSFTELEARLNGDIEADTRRFDQAKMVDDQGRTLLHCAASCPIPSQALKTMQVILDSKFWLLITAEDEELSVPHIPRKKLCASINPLKERILGDTLNSYVVVNIHPSVSLCNSKHTKFIDIQDKLGNTAMHYAADAEMPDVAQLLYKSIPLPDLNLRNREKIKAIQLLYSKCPSVIVSDFDQAVTILPYAKNRAKTYKLLFGCIIGGWTKNRNFTGPPTGKNNLLPLETEWLSNALEYTENCKLILTHPLVELFLIYKWQKMRPVFCLSFLWNLIGLVMTAWFFMSVFRQQCCCFNGSDLGNGTVFYEFQWLSVSGQSTTIGSGEIIADENCHLDELHIVVLWVVTFFHAITILKEVYQIWNRPSVYFNNGEKYVQWGLISAVVIDMASLMAGIHRSYMYVTASFAVFLACSLMLMQLARIPDLTKTTAIFTKVLTDMCKFLGVFSALFVAFGLSFSILLPENKSFSSLLGSVTKTLVMMTGELNYDEVVTENGSTTVVGLFLALFAIIFCFTLINLLIGFAVTDMQTLKKDTGVRKQHNQLQQLYLLETFWLSETVQKFCGKRLLKHLLVAPPLSFSTLRTKHRTFWGQLPNDKIRRKLQAIVRNRMETRVTIKVYDHEEQDRWEVSGAVERNDRNRGRNS